MSDRHVLLVIAIVVLAPVWGAVVVSAAPVENDTYAVAQGTSCTAIQPVTNESQNATAFYDYRNPNTEPNSSTFSSFGTTEYQETSTSTLLFYEGSEGASIVLVHDELGDEAGGSTLTMAFEGLPADGEWVVEDDEYPGRDDDWVLGETTATIDWLWGPNRTDGGVYHGIGNASGPIVVTPGFNEDATYWGDWTYSGSDAYRIDAWRLIDADGSTTLLDRDRRVFIHGGECVETPPSAALTGPSSADTGEAITLDAGGTTDDDAIGGYEWDFDGDGEIDEVTTGPTVEHAFEAAGNRTVAVTAFDTYGNGDTAELQVNVTVPSTPPNASLDAPEAATVNETVTLDASDSTDEGTITGYEWDLDGDGAFDVTTTDPILNHTYNETGTVDPAVTVIDDDNETATASATIEIQPPNQPPTAALDAPAEVRVDQPVTFDASNATDDEGIEEYRWDFNGDGTTDAITTDPVVEHSYENATSGVEASVTVVDAAGLNDTASVTLDVLPNQPPTASLDAPTNATVGEPVTFDASNSTDDGGIEEYRWDFDGDGSVDETTTAPVVEQSYENATSGVGASVTVVDAAGLNDTASVTLDVLPPDDPPTVSLDAPTNATVGESATFDASNATDDEGIEEYRWDFNGDGTTDAETDDPTANYTYETAGSFDATVTVEDTANQTATASASVTVDAPASPPAAALSAPGEATAGQPLTLDASDSTDDGTITAYRWDFDGDGTIDAETVGSTVEHTYNGSGDFEPAVTVVDDDNQTDTATASIGVEAANWPPNVTVDPPSEVLVDEPVTLDVNVSTGGDDDGGDDDDADEVEVEAYRWDFDGDGEIDAETESSTVEHAFTDPGRVPVSVTVVGDDGQTTTASTTIVVGDPAAATAAIGVDTADPTAGEPVSFDATNATAATQIVDYDWAFGDGAGGTGATVDHNYTAAGEYEVTLTITTEGGVTANATTAVSVAAPDGGDDGNTGNNDGENDGGGDDGGGDDGDSNDGGSNDGGSNDGGSNDGDSNDDGSNDDDSNDGGSNDGGSNDGGQSGGNSGGQSGGNQSTEEPEPDPEPDIGQANVSLGSQELLVGETLVAEATVTNRGNGSGTKTVEFEVEGEVLESRQIPLAPGETRTVTFSHQFTSPGNKSVEVDQGLTRTVEVRPREPNISVASLSVDEHEVEPGEQFTIVANVTNTGEAPGEQTVALELFGETVATKNVSLSVGDSASVTFTRSVVAAGSYDATVGDETVQVTVVDNTATPQPSSSTTTESPGLGPLSALAALAAVAAALRRRRN